MKNRYPRFGEKLFLLALILSISLLSNAQSPTVTTTAATSIGGTSAVLGGNVTSQGSAAVTERGIVWATTTNPTTANNKVANGSGTGTYSGTVGSLPSSTLIYFRAYAINSVGTSYGSNLSFTTAAALSTSSTSQTNISCNGVCNGSASVTATGGSAPYSYSWAPSGGSGSSASGLCAMNYTVTITDAVSASITRTFSLSQPAAVTAPTPSSNSPVCSGNIINLSTPTVSGATYSWTGPASFASSLQNPSRANATAAMAGTYSVTITVGGCTSATKTTAVVVNSTPATPSPSSNSPVCTSNTINLSTAAVAGATYSWTGPSSFTSSLQNPTRANATAAMAGTYSVTVTANGCTSGVGTTPVVVNTTPATPSPSSNSPVCISNTINLSTAAVAGATYSWTGPASFASSLQNPSRANATATMAGTYSVTVTTNGCTSGQGTTAVTVPSAINTSVTSNTASCTGINSGSATIFATGGSGGYTYAWVPSGGTATTATNLWAGTYTVTVTDASNCSKTQTLVIGSSPPTQAGGLAGSTGSMTSQTQAVTDASGNYNDGNCNRIATITPSGASPLSGSATTAVWIETSVPTYGGSSFVARHYQITPALNAATATAIVTLYFLQSEFDAFNATTAPLKLPADPADATGIANLRIGKYSGSSSDNSGLPASYPGPTTVIDPDDANIVWNSTVNRWEVSFAVAGFSGFVVQTSQSPLPLALTSFRAKMEDNNVILQWKTATEQNTDRFEIERSGDGRHYNSIGMVDAAGNSDVTKTYSYTDQQPLPMNYYRLRMVDQDGSSTYSTIIAIKTIVRSDLEVFPNPASNTIFVQLSNSSGKHLQLFDITGKLITTIQVNGNSLVVPIPVSKLAKGTYYLKAGKTTVQFVKE